jgi:hypothetical protein
MAPASRTGSSRTFPGWVTIMPMTGVPHVHGPARHEPGIVTCLRSAMLLAGGVAAGRSSGRCSTPPGSSGCSVPVAPRTGPARAERLGHYAGHALAARSEPFSRHAAPRVADGRRHRPRRSWRPCSARPLSRPNPKHGQVRFDAPASSRRDRSRDPSVSIPCTSAPPNDAFCTPELKEVEVRVDLPNGIVRGTPAAERYGVWRQFERQATRSPPKVTKQEGQRSASRCWACLSPASARCRSSPV